MRLLPSSLWLIALLFLIPACGGTDERDGEEQPTVSEETSPHRATDRQPGTRFFYDPEKAADTENVPAAPIQATVTDIKKKKQTITGVTVIEVATSFFGPDEEEKDFLEVSVGEGTIEVPLSRLKTIKSLEAATSKEGESEDVPVRVRLENWEGKTIDVDVDRKMKLKGDTDFGAYKIDLAGIRTVEFLRPSESGEKK